MSAIEGEAAANNITSESVSLKTDDPFSLKVKPEFILSARSTSLPPLLPTNGNDDGRVDDRDGADSRSDKQGKKKHRGMNKKRPRDKRIDQADKLCVAIMNGGSCSYGDSCRFSHDMKAYLTSRPDDIKELEGGCPNFNVHGRCEYGVMCRLGSSHVNMSTGENLSKDITPTPEPVMNILDKDVQQQLRRNNYPFKCKRHYQTNGEGKKQGKGDDERFKDAVENDADKTTLAVLATESSALDPALSGILEKTEEFPAATSSERLHMAPLPTMRKIIDFSNKVYIAPLTTVGNLPFRRVMKRFGADITCGEMAVASCILEGKPQEWALLKRHPEEDIFGVQLAAGYPDQFTRACELIEAHAKVDFVDLNLGCPLDLICNKGAGACLMLRENRLKPALQGITSTLTCPVTVKMRTGWDTAKPIAHMLVPRIQSWGLGGGIGAIMVHGRSRLQRYSKDADWDYIAQVAASQDKSLPLIPIIGNGDIYSFDDYEQKVTLEGLSTCAMLGRGALIKPWLPTEIKEKRHWDISANERLDILRDFVRFGLEHWGSDQQGVNSCRRFLLEWMSFLHRYVPVGMLETASSGMNQRPPKFLQGRNDLETLFLSSQSSDWIKISEMLLGPVPEDFRFEPKHKANAYQAEG
jgi:tRNA-dihydrouridine synthase 3